MWKATCKRENKKREDENKKRADILLKTSARFSFFSFRHVSDSESNISALNSTYSEKKDDVLLKNDYF